MPMKVIVVGCKKARITARIMAECLGADYTEEYIPHSAKYGCVFRYGNTNVLWPPEMRPRVIINSAHAITLSSDKPLARSTLLNHGIPCPQIYSLEQMKTAEKHRDAISYIFPLIARPRHHFQGREFKIINNAHQASELLQQGSYYFQQIVDKEAEYRVFVYNHRIFEINQKIDAGNAENILVRNHQTGWFFKWISQDDMPKGIMPRCKEATNVLGLDWAAIDCALDSRGNPVIFEVNSAPGLIRRKCEKLATAIIGFLSDVAGEL